MCIVPSFTVHDKNKSAALPGPKVPYIEEALLYDLEQSRVQIFLTVIVSYESGPAVDLHLTHRRAVSCIDATAALRFPNGEDVLLCLLQNLRAGERSVDTSSTGPELVIKPLGPEPREVIKARIPQVGTGNGIMFQGDIPESHDVEPALRPFTTCSFGPISADPKPLALGVGIEISGPAFKALVPKVNQYGWKYFYDVAGPSVALREMRLDDLAVLPERLARMYRPIFKERIEERVIPVPSYAVITFDKPDAGYKYTRAVAQVESLNEDAKVPVTPASGTEWLANVWHSAAPDFLILRRSVIGADESTDQGT